jgi:Tfp pilus assembly protein PilF/TolB-like protein
LSFAEADAASGRTLVVIPFENTSPTPGLDWASEAFPEGLRQQLNSPLLYVASREDVVRAYDRQGIPVALHPSRATLYRVAEQMDVDYAVLGSYKYDGAVLTATAQLLDMRAQRLLPATTESAPLTDLGTVQSALAWDLLHSIRPNFSLSKVQYLSERTPMRLDALENYIRGVMASTPDQKEQHFKEAVRLNPAYSEAWLELGKAYLQQHQDEPAMNALSHVLPASPAAREANFYLGLAAYDHGDFARAQAAFEFVAARLPLAEVSNNMGVVAARRGRKDSAEYFERAVRTDPSDADYRFNLGVALSQARDNPGATRELRAALEHRPGDAEAKALLASLGAPQGVVPAAAIVKAPAERIKRNYDEDAFRQLTTQMQGWVEQRFARSDAHAHARFHVERGKELLADGFAAEAESEFRHARAVDPSSTAPLLGLVDTALARGDNKEARSQAEAALRQHESADAYVVLARLDLSENRVEAAADNLKQAARLEPANPEVQNLKRAVAAKLAEKGQKP